ncbi:DUF1566 domain-containing protein [Vibrio sp. 99-8-1]|uniref:Lcl domain-containing protein n=1 Tax=Vibrio sp. 99-8-1 TaxID=2607602 RepID=UPI0020A45B74|nr:DUF1566 domain-containing protein [Vibrio sp. 99-8-1]
MSHTINSNTQHSLPRFSILASVMALMWGSGVSATESPYRYTIVDTNQTQCSDTSNVLNQCAMAGKQGAGQDAQYQGYSPSYTLNNDGTVLDNNTGLQWAQTTDINGDGNITAADKVSYNEGQLYAASLELGGHSDWRVPTIKELYSLMMFDGEDPSGINGAGTYTIRPFIDHSMFAFESGDLDAGERLIDSQYLSSTKYVSTTMNGDETIFGVNFIDGRIKGYGATSPRGGDKTFYLLTVRGNTDYGINQFVDNGNKTVNDKATGLTWQQGDSEHGMEWFSALEYCENLELAGSNDWRLPNAKELQSIVDYTKSPDTSNSAAIDSSFSVTSIINEGEKIDYPNYWSSTTHQNLKNSKNASYIAFGRSLGYMNNQWVDVHGAGAQRSDPKTYAGQDYPQGHGPQGDAVRYKNYVRCVTDSNTQFIENPSQIERDSKQYVLDGTEAGMDMKVQGGMKPAVKEFGDSERLKPQDQRGNPMINMDRNGDGKLSKSEVQGPLKNDFNRIDKNGDGYITEDELPEPPKRRKK